MATVCERPRNATRAAPVRAAATRGYDFVLSASDARALIAAGTWDTVVSVATGFDCNTQHETNADQSAHRAAMCARFGA